MIRRLVILASLALTAVAPACCLAPALVPAMSLRPDTPDGPPFDFPDNWKWWTTELSCNGQSPVLSVQFLVTVAQLQMNVGCHTYCDLAGGCYSPGICSGFKACFAKRNAKLWGSYEGMMADIKNCCGQHPEGGADLQACLQSVVNFWMSDDDGIEALAESLSHCCPSCPQ